MRCESYRLRGDHVREAIRKDLDNKDREEPLTGCTNAGSARILFSRRMQRYQ